MIQLYFEEVLDDLFIAKTCKDCQRDCKVSCLSEDAVIYCTKYKKRKQFN